MQRRDSHSQWYKQWGLVSSQEACAQLREYSAYFEDKANRDLIQREYGLLAYKPKMIVIIGRRGNVDPIIRRRIESDLPQLTLRTYDDVLARAKARIRMS